MELSPLILQWREEALQEGERVVIENLLRVCFGKIASSVATELSSEDVK